MKTIKQPAKKDWSRLCERPAEDVSKLNNLVSDMFEKIRTQGDKAVKAYTKKFDVTDLQNLSVSGREFDEAEKNLPEKLKAAINLAAENIGKFHASQKEPVNIIETAPGVFCRRESRPIEKVGIYIPAGTAPLFSTVLMLAIPARLAGCREIVLCSPPDKNGQIHPAVLYAAKLTGVSAAFKIGGIQAVGALTFGTESVPKVYKIFGPGNQYVTAAKQAAQNYGVAMDLPAGPSELLVIADKSAKPEYVAADLLSQAEHGPDSQVILLSDNDKTSEAVLNALEIQLEQLPRKATAQKALENSQAITFNNVSECIDFSNAYAPEHLIMAVENPDSYSPRIINAGSVFLGNYTCESVGDYASGTNHTLPTNGYARNYSGVSLDSFIKKITFQELTKEGLNKIGPAIEQMAEAEALFGHKNAVSLRLKDITK